MKKASFTNLSFLFRCGLQLLLRFFTLWELASARLWPWEVTTSSTTMYSSECFGSGCYLNNGKTKMSLDGNMD